MSPGQLARIICLLIVVLAYGADSKPNHKYKDDVWDHLTPEAYRYQKELEDYVRHFEENGLAKTQHEGKENTMGLGERGDTKHRVAYNAKQQDDDDDTALDDDDVDKGKKREDLLNKLLKELST